jgi:peptidoglycan/LPS O-acetylase OafA/YrhL
VKIFARVVIVLFLIVMLSPILLPIIRGDTLPTSESSTVRGLRVWLYGIGGYGFLRKRAWGWWLVFIGAILVPVVMLQTIVAGEQIEPFLWIVGIVGLLAVFALLVYRPSTWHKKDLQETP